MAEQDGLPWRTLAEVEEAARGFLDPLLSEVMVGKWEPSSWSWRPS
jgi:hypothetical protein